MTDAKPATDEELDAGLVERTREIIFGKPSFYTDVPTETLRVKRALLSLPIPAAAINALARGEAVVVPKNATKEMQQAVAVDEDEWHELHQSEVWARMLAASPYAAKE